VAGVGTPACEAGAANGGAVAAGRAVVVPKIDG
jgi:hypothetical protein